MAFRGWPTEAIRFFEGLEADNSKAYWSAHKDEYEQCVRRPMAELLEELSARYGEGRIFRPYRDVRFSRDKSPYRTNVAATLSGGGYVRLDADVLGVGAGIYMMSADQLARYRAAVDDDASGRELERIVAGLAEKGIEVSSHDVLKTAPRGYSRDHPRLGLLRQKDLVAWQEWPVGDWIATVEPKRRVVGFLRATTRLREWL
ncbi:MAG TPA: DUF2461 domain-containing protein, partial [Acidimicrobiales bacterium]|nr:DUF2461 domain-containing protein [Acidimicrobiales bacterium]